MATTFTLPTECQIQLPIEIPDIQIPDIPVEFLDLLDVPDVELPDLSIDLSEFGIPCLNTNITACNVDIMGRAVQSKINQLKDLPKDNLTNIRNQASNLIAELNSLLPSRQNLVNFAEDLVATNMSDPVQSARLYKKWQNVVDSETFQTVLAGFKYGRLDICDLLHINADPATDEFGRLITRVDKAVEPLVPASLPTTVVETVNSIQSKLASVSPFGRRNTNSITEPMPTLAEVYNITPDQALEFYQSYQQLEESASSTYDSYYDSTTSQLNSIESELSQYDTTQYWIAFRNDQLDKWISKSPLNSTINNLENRKLALSRLQGDLQALNVLMQSNIRSLAEARWNLIFQVTPKPDLTDLLNLDVLIDQVNSSAAAAEFNLQQAAQHIYDSYKDTVWPEVDLYIKYLIGTNRICPDNK